MPDALVPYAIRAYDLQAPSRLLVPGPPHMRTGYRQSSVTIGDGAEAAVLTVTRWQACQRGCSGGGSVMSSHDAGFDVRLRVPCDSLPHCSACDCGDSHTFVLPSDKVAELKALLP